MENVLTTIITQTLKPLVESHTERFTIGPGRDGGTGNMATC